MPKTVMVNLLEGNKVIARFSSIGMASDLTGADTSHISKVARGLRRTAGSYGWSYVLRGSLTSGKMGVRQLDKVTGEVIATYKDLDAVERLTGITSTRLLNVIDENRVLKGSYWVSSV